MNDLNYYKNELKKGLNISQVIKQINKNAKIKIAEINKIKKTQLNKVKLLPKNEWQDQSKVIKDGAINAINEITDISNKLIEAIKEFNKTVKVA